MHQRSLADVSFAYICLIMIKPTLPHDNKWEFLTCFVTSIFQTVHWLKKINTYTRHIVRLGSVGVIGRAWDSKTLNEGSIPGSPPFYWAHCLILMDFPKCSYICPHMRAYMYIYARICGHICNIYARIWGLYPNICTSYADICTFGNISIIGGF